MTEIKFRVWDKNKKFMDYDPELQALRPTKDFQNWGVNSLFINHSDWLIFMQYTGLKDKNDKEIYEGDILNRDGSGIKWAELVIFKDGMFCIYFNGQYILLKKHLEDLIDGAKIIGNIYENKELLK